MRWFENQVAVVTGAGSGLGLALAKALAGHGARLHLADVNAERLDAARRDIESSGGTVRTYTVDVSDPEAVKRLADQVFEAHGRVDLLFNNAGVCGGGPVETLSLEDWTWVLGTNLHGVIHGLWAFVPRMIAQGGGTVVNTASLAGLLGFPYMAPYSASKFAVVGLGESLASELAPRGIHVLTVCPAAVATNVMCDGRIALPGNSRVMVDRFFRRTAESPDHAAKRILKAVRKRRTRLVMTGAFWPLWALKQVSSSLYVALFRLVVRKATGPAR